MRATSAIAPGLLAVVVLLGGASGQGIAVRSATWSADDGDDNRDGGPMNDVFATCNGGSQYVRYRTGSSDSFTTLLTLAQPSDVAGVSVVVQQSPDTDGEGYSGIEISVSSGGAFRDVYSRHEMFGEFERGATHETMAADFQLGVPTAHVFDSFAMQVTQISLRMFYADISGDAAISFNSIVVDPPGAVPAVRHPPPPPSWVNGPPYIAAGKLSVADAAAANGNSGMMSWNFESGIDSPELFDRDLATPIGGDANGQHDDIVGVQLSRVCSTSSFAVYGQDRDVPATALRHIRVAYSVDGSTWTCYTQSDTGSMGDTPSFNNPSSDCSTYGPSHAPNGAVFNVNGPAQYVEFAFWGRTDIFEIELSSCDGVSLEVAPPVSIVEGQISTADQAYGMLSWDFTSGVPTPQLFDGDLATPVGGDENGQHDDIVAVRLSDVCQSSSYAVYGEDRDVPDTALRHVRVAYSLDGRAWTCYTQSDSGSEGGTPAFMPVGSGDADCSEGPSHAPNGAVFNIPQPAQYVEFAFWGRTDVFEVELTSCMEPEPQPDQAEAQVVSATWSADDGSDNREGGEMNDVFATCNGGDQYVRYRTGSSEHVVVTLELAEPATVVGVSILVRESPDTDGEGYGGVEVSTRNGQGGFTTAYSRAQMFGNFERAGHHGHTEEMAPDFAMGVPTAFVFDDVMSGVTQVQITLTAADIAGDDSVTFNSIVVITEQATDHACNIIAARLEAVNEECCDDGDPQCDSVPTTCNEGCAEVFLPFYDDCEISRDPQLSRTYKSFVKKCRRTVAACGSDGSRCRNGGECSAIDPHAIPPGGGHRRAQEEVGFVCACPAGFAGEDCSAHQGRGR
jgi:hypothetical protein